MLCPIAPLIYSRFISWCLASINSTAIRYNVSYRVQSLTNCVRESTLWLSDWISTQAVRVRIPSGMWDFFFQTMHHISFTNLSVSLYNNLNIVNIYALTMAHLVHFIFYFLDHYEYTPIQQTEYFNLSLLKT